MLEMPKRTVTQADGKKVSEAAASCAPPLAHRSAQLALLFTQRPPCPCAGQLLHGARGRAAQEAGWLGLEQG